MKPYIPRTLYVPLENSLKNPYISALLGPRQTGKTTLLKKVQAKLLEQHSAKNVIFLNFDDLELRSSLRANPKNLFTILEEYCGSPLAKLSQKIYLFIDEVQKIPLIFDLLKILYDEYQTKIKIFISGSSALNIHKKAAETLAGRLRLFYLAPLSLQEIINHYLNPLSGSLLQNIIKGKINRKTYLHLQSQIYRQKETMMIYWRQLLLWGGLPGIFTESSVKEKQFLLRDFITTYIERDIRQLSEVGDIDLFMKVLQLFILEDSRLLNFSKISHDFDISRLTLHKYFSILKATHLFKTVSPLTKRTKQRLVKSQKIICFDNGPINYFRKIYQWDQLEASAYLGQTFENVIINNLLNYLANHPAPPAVSFWRNYSDQEIDLVIETSDQLIPVEITYQKKINQNKLYNFQAFFRAYPNSKIPFGLIVYNGEFQEIKINHRTIFAIPCWMWW